MNGRLSEKTLRMILAVGIVFFLMTLIQSELLLKILLLLSIVFSGFLLYPYASVRVTAIRKKLFGPLYGYRNLNLSLTGERLMEIADSLQSLAAGFRAGTEPVSGEPDKNRLMEEMSDKLCRECAECENCWSHKTENSYRAVCELLELACRDGRITAEKIPQGMRESCVQAERYVTELNRQLEQEKQTRLLCRQQEESRGIIAEQLAEVAGAVRRSSRMLCGREESTELQKQVLVSERAMGTVIVTNATEEPLNNICLYYKSWYSPQNILIGGIKYSVSIPVLAPGQTEYLYPPHYAIGYSKVVSVHIEEKTGR